MSTARGTRDRDRLHDTLRAARATAGLTQKQVAEAMGWSPSKQLRIEGGWVAISTNDLKALLEHYQITNKRRIDELVELARARRRQPSGA